MTSLDINDEASADMLLNSMQDVDYKLNDVVDISIKIKGERIINILKLIWEDDNYN